MDRRQLCAEIRDSLARLPAPHDAHYGVVPRRPPMTLGLPPSAIASLQSAATAMASLRALVTNRPALFHVTGILVRDEATRSSAIEGTQTTLDELLHAEAPLDDGTGVLSPQDGDLATVRAYSLALERHLAAPAPINGPLILGLHRDVFAASTEYADGRRGTPGAWRDRTVWIGGGSDIARSTFNPPPYPMVGALMDDHAAWLRDTTEGPATLATPIRLALAHAFFEAVHPFTDGNGRVGRMLLTLMLAQEGHLPVPLSRVLERDRRRYYDALRLAQQRLEFTELVLLMCEALETSAREAEALDRRLAAMPAMWRTAERWPGGRMPRRDGAANRLLDMLPYHPVVTTAGVARRLGVTTQAANLALRALLAVGIVVERTGWRRNRMFACPAALAAILAGDT